MTVLVGGGRDQDYVENRFEVALARSPLAARDRALAQELIYGVVRWQATLDWLIARKASRPIRSASLLILLRLGLYQMFWLDRVPNYAAVNETVELAKKSKLSSQAGFLNAVLRAYARERQSTKTRLEVLKTQQPSLGFSHPEWLCEAWRERWGDQNLLRLLAWNNQPPPTFARLNTLRTDAAQLTALWEREGVQFTPRNWDWTGNGLVYELLDHPPLDQLPSFLQGGFYLQDPSTLLAPRVLNPQSGEEVLDLCAAPGGKATFIAQLLQNHGTIVALEAQPARLQQLQDNCARLGAGCISAGPLATPTMAALDVEASPPLASAGVPGSTPLRLPSATEALPPPARKLFDRVLVDVPCSNTGVLRRRVDLRWRLRPEEPARLAQLQASLLQQAAVRLKPGGTLVYSTCSLEPVENAQVVQQFLANHPQFRLDHERQLLPFADAVDGAYVARLVRV